MSTSCSLKFSPHSVTSEQVHQVIQACKTNAFKGRLTGSASLQDNGRVDWLLTYYSSDPKKEGIVYAVIPFRLNAQGHTLGFNVAAKASAFSRWVICHLMNEIALQLNGLIRAEGFPTREPHPISPTLSTFLQDTYSDLPHHMLTQQAGAFPPEFSLEDNWIYGNKIKTSDVPTCSLGGLEAGESRQALDEKESLLPS